MELSACKPRALSSVVVVVVVVIAVVVAIAVVVVGVGLFWQKSAKSKGGIIPSPGVLFLSPVRQCMAASGA